MSDPSAKSGGCTAIFGWTFMLVWCGGVFYADAVIVWGIVRQTLTLRYDETVGIITSS